LLDVLFLGTRFSFRCDGEFSLYLPVAGAVRYTDAEAAGDDDQDAQEEFPDREVRDFEAYLVSDDNSWRVSVGTWMTLIPEISFAAGSHSIDLFPTAEQAMVFRDKLVDVLMVEEHDELPDPVLFSIPHNMFSVPCKVYRFVI